MSEYDIHKVTRHILVYKTKDGADTHVYDLSEFRNRAEAEKVLASLRAMSPEDAAEDARFRYVIHNSPAMIIHHGDGRIGLSGHNGQTIATLAPGEAIKNIGDDLVIVPADPSQPHKPLAFEI